MADIATSTATPAPAVTYKVPTRRHPLLGFALLMFMGLQSFYSLPITRFPNIDVPVVSVTVTQSGAAQEVLA